MNLTRWSARLPGTQRRGVPKYGRGRRCGPRRPQRRAGRNRPPRRCLEQLSVHELLGQVPALIAVTFGPEHRIGYVNDAYQQVFGPRDTGRTGPRGAAPSWPTSACCR